MKPLSGDDGKNGSAACIFCGKDAASYKPSSHHLPPGTILKDRYLLGGVLGEGGYGITYIGYDRLLQNRIAVKEYFPIEFCTRDTIGGNSVNILSGISAKNYAREMQKYLTEARLLAKMEKQRVIVNVRDYFEDNRTAYIVMEYIQGITFTELTRRSGGRISEDLLFPVVEPLFGALCSLHQYGLIHRDMCPDNLMLETGSNLSDCSTRCPSGCKKPDPSSLCQKQGDPQGQSDLRIQAGGMIQEKNDHAGNGRMFFSEESLRHKDNTEERDRIIRGRVRLLDFGSARSSDSLKDTLTITLRHGFAPIEQYQQGGGQGPWTDVYALCATLYFCLTGITPPVATNRIIEDSLIPPSGLGVEITPSRENALMRGLRVQPHRRCRTIRDLWSAFYR